LFNERGGNPFEQIHSLKPTVNGLVTWVADYLDIGETDYLDYGSFYSGWFNDAPYTVILDAIILDLSVQKTSLWLGQSTYSTPFRFINQYGVFRVNIYANYNMYYANFPSFSTDKRNQFSVVRVDNSEFSVYCNSDKGETNTSAIGTLPSDTQPLRLGYNNAIKVWRLLLYTRALNVTELAQLHAEPYSFILVPQYWYMVDFGVVGAATTAAPTTIAPTTQAPTTSQPTTTAPTTAQPTTVAPTTAKPTTAPPTTLAPTTTKPTTAPPTTQAPTTVQPTTVPPTTVKPTTPPPTTVSPTTILPTTIAGTTVVPTTALPPQPTTVVPTTVVPLEMHECLLSVQSGILKELLLQSKITKELSERSLINNEVLLYGDLCR